MNKKFKNIIITFLLFIVTCAIFTTAIIINRDARIDIILDGHSQTLETYYDIFARLASISASVSS